MIAAGSTTEVEQKSFEQKSVIKHSTTKVWLRCFNGRHKRIYNCHVKKFYWYCQIFGSGSNTLNSQKFPGHISPRPSSSYGMGLRVTCRRPPCWQARLVREGLIPFVNRSIQYETQRVAYCFLWYAFHAFLWLPFGTRLVQQLPHMGSKLPDPSCMLLWRAMK